MTPTAYWYDPAGNRTIEQIANAVTTSTYNSLNQMTGRGGGGLLALTGTLDRPGTVTVSGTTYTATGSNNAFAAVAPVTAGSNNIAISATNVNGYGVTKTLGVNVTGGTAIPSLTYDPDGDLTNDSANTYGWDAVNRLTAVNYPAGGCSTFRYDGLGRRVQIVESGSGGAVTSTKDLVWEGMNICEEKNAGGTVTKRYFPQGVQIGGTNYYYTRDYLGSIREMTDGSGTVQARYDYDPYGRQTQLSGTMSADFGFTGFYVHQPSGLDLSMYRPYIPPLGRWGSRDPIGERGGINLYGYVHNSPTKWIDPLGLEPPGYVPPGNQPGPGLPGGAGSATATRDAIGYTGPCDLTCRRCCWFTRCVEQFGNFSPRGRLASPTCATVSNPRRCQHYHAADAR